MPRANKKSEHYVDNKKLYAEMVEYLNSVKEAEESGADKPRIPEYIGECLLKISNRLSTRPNFINYTYRDEMISDGIENCVNYIGNFNPEKSTNPFAYFTQIIYFAFLRRIQREKKQLYIKHKSLERSIVFDPGPQTIVSIPSPGNILSFPAAVLMKFAELFPIT